jgi:hypothetical protein
MPIDAKIVFATFFVRFQFPPILGLRFLFEPGLNFGHGGWIEVERQGGSVLRIFSFRKISNGF